MSFGQGRPKKEVGDLKTRVIQFRVSEEDYCDIFQAAEDAELSLSEFIRQTVVDEANAIVYGRYVYNHGDRA